MATRKISAATAMVNTDVASGDKYPIVDISDTTDASSGTTKSITSDEHAESIGAYPTGTKVYRALLTQSGANAPVATVLQNTLGGTVVWAYLFVGEYTATLAGAFTSGKFMIKMPPVIYDGALVGFGGYDVTNADLPNSIGFTTTNENGVKADSILQFSQSIEIIVFP